MPRRRRSSNHRMATEVDVQVGERLRQRRMLRGLSQAQLANAVGVSFQQIQKYETGRNRLSVSRLHQLAAVLGVTTPWFFQGAGTAARNDELADLVSDRDTLQFIRAYNRIADTLSREKLRRLASVLAGGKP